MAKAFIDLSTAGMKVAYAIETVKGTKPASFINIPNPKSIPDFNPEVSTLETSSLNIPSGGFKTYIQGLRDIGGSVGVTFGMSAGFLEMWNTKIAKASQTAALEGKRLWIEFYHPSLTDGFFFTAEVAELGWPSADVDAVWDATASITPTGEIGWATAIAPTDED